MQFRDLKKQYQVLKTDMDQAMLDAVASGAFIMGKQVMWVSNTALVVPTGLMR